MKEKCTVICLPAKDMDSPAYTYICSDSEKEEGDFVINITNKRIIKVKELVKDLVNSRVNGAHLKKIIASTEPSLGLPAPSEKFIEQFVSSKGEIKCFVEMEQKEIDCPDKIEGCEVLHLKSFPKLSPSNEIIISLIEEEKIYGREDMENAYQRGRGDYPEYNFNKWFDENY